jgi:hypothetical protein
LRQEVCSRREDCFSTPSSGERSSRETFTIHRCFRSLRNYRDYAQQASGHCPAGTIEKVTCWPMKEVPNNLDTTTGMFGLTDEEEN